MVWIKFHEEITRGAKRGIPRALRFVFLELSLLARPGRGTIELPLGMSDLDAVHDLLGGNRREIKDALDIFSCGDDAPLQFLGVEGKGRCLVIPSWSRWNSGTEATGASTERSRRSRQKQRGNNDDQADKEPPGNTDATTVAEPMQRLSNADATVEQRSLEKSREEKSREEKRRSHTHTAGAGEAREAPPPAASAEPSSPQAAELLAELRAHPVLADVATTRLAESLESRRMNTGRPVADVRRAIGEAARDLDAEEAVSGPLMAHVKATKVTRYADRARPPREPHSLAKLGPGGVRAALQQPAPPGSPLAWVEGSGTEWMDEAAEAEAAAKKGTG